MNKAWTRVTLSEVLTQDKDYVLSLDSIAYKKLSVRLYGKGVVLATPTNGSDIRMEKHQFAKPGQIIVSEIWAKKGALGVVPDIGAGALVTSHFFLFDISSERLLPDWMRWILKGNFLQSQLAAEAFGTTGYAAVRPTSFLEARIPLPSPAEQRSITRRLNAIEESLDRVGKLRESSRVGLEALTISLHLSLAGNREVELKQLLVLDEEQEIVSPDGSYPQVGIRSFGLGIFKKPAVSGSGTTYRAFNVLRPGHFVMSQVKGWEGAVGVAGDDLEGWYASPEYRTFSCIKDECDPGYLSFLVATSWFRARLASATRGVGARRERVRPEMLLALEIPFPTIEKQRSAVNVLKRLDASRRLSSRCSVLEAALLPSILDRVFGS